ncbi:MAG: hypothetical protein C4320_05190, partial [Armatimonadota bacterium]
EAARANGVSNAQSVATAICIYLADYDEVFPNAASTAQAQAAVAPYIKNQALWTTANPNGGRLLYNTYLARISMSRIEQPAETLLLWDENAWPDGGRVVAFADGKAKYLSDAQWTAAWKAELSRRTRTKVPAPRAGSPLPPKKLGLMSCGH